MPVVSEYLRTYGSRMGTRGVTHVGTTSSIDDATYMVSSWHYRIYFCLPR